MSMDAKELVPIGIICGNNPAKSAIAYSGEGLENQAEI